MSDNSIARHLAALARELEAEEEPGAVLQRVVDAAAAEVPGAEHAGITLLGRKGVSTPAFTHELVVWVDALQYRTRQGPCLDASGEQSVVRADELATESRWPAFASGAVRLGVGSMISFGLFVEAETVGALNLYAAKPFAFGAVAEDVGAPLAAHAAVALVATRERAQLRIALDNRDVIGQAKGILMERHKISARRAFDLLIAVSQRGNVKLYEVAAHLVESGIITPSPSARGAR